MDSQENRMDNAEAHIKTGDDIRSASRSSSTEDKLEEKIANLDVDDTWECVGNFGRYQMEQLAILSLCTFAYSWHMLSYVFIGYEPPHVCNVMPNISDAIYPGINVSRDSEVSLDVCSIELSTGNRSIGLSCIYGHNYSVPKSSSVLSEWNYVCDDRETGQLPQSLIIAGQGLGALVGGLADHIGRRKTLMLGLTSIFAVTFSTAFVQSFWLFSIFRFFTGASQQIIITSTIVAGVELMHREDRGKVLLLRSVCWSTTLLVMGLIAYLLRSSSWRVLEIVLSCSAISVVVIYFFMDESLRLLIVKKKTKDARRVLEKISKKNKVPLEKILEKAQMKSNENTLPSKPMSTLISEQTGVTEEHINGNVGKEKKEHRNSEGICQSGEKRVIREGLVGFVKTPGLLKQSGVIWFGWFVTVLVYYGLFLGPFPSVTDRFLQFTINSLIDLVSVLPKWILLLRLTRRNVAILTHLVGGLALLASTALFSIDSLKDYVTIPVTILTIIGRMAISVAFSLWFLFTPELFPTNLRNTGLGIASFCGRFGGMIAPFSATLAIRVPWAPGVMFATGSLIVAFLVRFVAETSDKQLPQKTKDIETWGNIASK